MSTELKIPDVGESIQEVQIGQWLKDEGDSVQQDENVVELETDKASMDLPAPTSGRLSKILKRDGDTVSVGETIAYIDETNGQGGQREKAGDDSEEPLQDSAADVTQEAEDEERNEAEDDSGDGGGHRQRQAGRDTGSKPETQKRHQIDNRKSEDRPTDKRKSVQRKSGQRKSGKRENDDCDSPQAARSPDTESIPVTPSGRRALLKHGLAAAEVVPKGKRIRRKDVERHVAQRDDSGRNTGPTGVDKSGSDREVAQVERSKTDTGGQDNLDELEELVPMSLIRRRIAERLVEAQQNAALLTTFNQIDMTTVIECRKRYQEKFRSKYSAKLGYMSFFVKAAVDALKECPEINAEIRGSHILYRNYYHIGIAIGSGKGLVVPVFRNAERLSFAEIETTIADFVDRANANELAPDDLQDGTFTISNGGVYGSLLSTPIVNPPQSGVLGMHAIEQRPVAIDGQVVIRPMMYVALTYDHRIVDGAEAVSFLKRIKEAVEDPLRMLVEV